MEISTLRQPCMIQGCNKLILEQIDLHILGCTTKLLHYLITHPDNKVPHCNCWLVTCLYGPV